MKTSLAGFDAAKKHREFYAQQVPCLDKTINPATNLPICSSPTATGDLTDPIDTAGGTGIFVNPGLDNIGNVGYNTYRGPGFFNEDLGLSKAFTIRGSIATKFRMDAYNVFNHINPGNPAATSSRKATSLARDRAAQLATWNSLSAFSSNLRRNSNRNTRGASAPLVLSLNIYHRSMEKIALHELNYEPGF
jgi:hypothetical protein